MSPRGPIFRWRKSIAWSPSFALFNLEPQGDHTICICPRHGVSHARLAQPAAAAAAGVGAARGGQEGADKICATTPDRRFSLRTVACFGQCALAPVVEVDHAIYRPMNEQALHREVEQLNGRKA